MRLRTIHHTAAKQLLSITPRVPSRTIHACSTCPSNFLRSSELPPTKSLARLLQSLIVLGETVVDSRNAWAMRKFVLGIARRALIPDAAAQSLAASSTRRSPRLRCLVQLVGVGRSAAGLRTSVLLREQHRLSLVPLRIRGTYGNSIWTGANCTERPRLQLDSNRLETNTCQLRLQRWSGGHVVHEHSYGS